MTDGQFLYLLWGAFIFGPLLLWMGSCELVRYFRRRRNVIDLSEWREQRELDEAVTRHPAGHCKVRGGRVVIR